MMHGGNLKKKMCVYVLYIQCDKRLHVIAPYYAHGNFAFNFTLPFIRNAIFLEYEAE
jgi:hypothetical protein